MTAARFDEDITAALVEFRALAEARMNSTAAVMRPTGGETTTEDGYTVPEWATVHTGPFRLGGSEQGGSSRTVRVGENEAQLAVRVASFPAATSGLRDGDLIEVTSGENAGLVLRIIEATWQDQATARRFPVVEDQRPEEWS